MSKPSLTLKAQSFLPWLLFWFIYSIFLPVHGVKEKMQAIHYKKNGACANKAYSSGEGTVHIFGLTCWFLLLFHTSAISCGGILLVGYGVVQLLPCPQGGYFPFISVFLFSPKRACKISEAAAETSQLWFGFYTRNVRKDWWRGKGMCEQSLDWLFRTRGDGTLFLFFYTLWYSKINK